MYIAMNHFRVKPEASEQFEQRWRDRETYLEGVPGFREFRLLRGPVEDGAQLYASHSIWDGEGVFRAWTESESFRKAHAQGSVAGILLGPPKFVGWEVVEL
jgi:heme-degrading monooxygenase HmoA